MRNLYFVGTTDRLFSNSASWSLTNGGAGGQSKPTSIDNVIFTDNSPVLELDENVNINSLVSPSSDGACGINFNGFNMITEGEFSIGAGSYDFGSGSHIFGNSVDCTVSFGFTNPSTVLDLGTGTIVLKNVTKLIIGNAGTFHNLEIAPSGKTVLMDNDYYFGDWNWDGYLKICGGTLKYMGAHNTPTHTYIGSDANPFRFDAGSDIDTNNLPHEHQPLFLFTPSTTLTMNLPALNGTNMEWRMAFSPENGDLEVHQGGNMKITELRSYGTNATIFKTYGYNIIGPTTSNWAQLDWGGGTGAIFDMSDQSSGRTTTIQMLFFGGSSDVTFVQGNSIIDLYCYHDVDSSDWSSLRIFGTFTKGTGEIRLTAASPQSVGYGVYCGTNDMGTVIRKNDGTGYCDLSQYSDFICTTFTINGKMDFKNRNVTCTAAFDGLILSSTADVKGLTGSIITTPDVSIDPSATISMGTATWKLGSASPTTSDFAHRTISKLEIVQGSDQVSFADYFTCTGEFKMSHGQALYLPGETAQPFAFGSLNWEGLDSDHITYSGSEGVSKINVTTPSTVHYVDVTDSDASYGAELTDVDGSGTGTTTNWVFTPVGISVISKSIGVRSAYATGTIAINSTGLVVTLSGGTFNSNWGKGDALTIDVGGTPETRYVLSRNSDTQITLQSPSTRVSESGLAFSIARAYSSIPNWESDTDNDLVTAEQIQEGVCYNDADFVEASTIVIAGATTDATHYRILTAAEGHRHLGDLTAGANLDGKFSVTEKHFHIEWLRLHHETADDSGAYIIDCLGGNTSKFLHVNHMILHDWNCVGNYDYLFGIRISGNGGCRIFNTLICNLYKDNDDSDDGGLAGIYAGGTSAPDDNYIANVTVLNLTCAAVYMKADGGIGVYNDQTHVWNCIAMVRQYVYDQSSIGNIIPRGSLTEAEDYRYDFTDYAHPDSGYNCEKGGGYKQLNFLPGADPNHSLTGQDPFDVFVFPGPGPDIGNGFYGYGWTARSLVEPYWLHTDTFIYQAAPTESGKITFDSMFIMDCVGGFLYVNSSTFGAMYLMRPDGTPFDQYPANPAHFATRTFNGTFSYDRDANTFTLDSGDPELADVVEMVNGRIQFKTSFIPTNWATHPITPSGGNYEQDDLYPNLVKGFVTGPAVLCVGQIHNNSFSYEITNRSTLPNFDPHIRTHSPCVGTGVNLLSLFPELEYDITNVSRGTGLWDMGAYKSTAEPPSPTPDTRISAGVQIPAPETLGRKIRHTYQTVAMGHRNKSFKLFADTHFELQKRFRTPDFSIVASDLAIYDGPHDPGAQYKFSDLTSYYPFDGSTDVERLADLSGLGNTLTLIGNGFKPTFVDGQYLTALFTNVVSNSGAYTENCLFPNLDQGFVGFTVDSWLATRPIVTLNADMLLYSNTGTTNFKIWLTADLKVKIEISNAGANKLLYYSEFPYMLPSALHHLVVTYHKALLADGTVGVPIIRVFVDSQERITSLFQHDTGAPLELVYGGDTRIGENAGLLIDEFRTHGHALTQSEVNTEYQYRLQSLLFDDLDGTELLSDNWGSYGVVDVGNSLVLFPGVASITSKFLLRSKQFHVLTSLYLDATAHDTAGKLDTFLRAMLISGSTYIAFKIAFDVVTGSSETSNVPSLHIEYNNVDGSTDYTLIDLEAPVFNLLEKTYYRFDLETVRNGKAVDFFLTIYKWGKNTSDVTGSERWLSIQDRIYVYSVKTTFDYFFSLKMDSGSTDSALGLGVDSVRVISKDNIIKYTPITYGTEEV